MPLLRSYNPLNDSRFYKYFVPTGLSELIVFSIPRIIPKCCKARLRHSGSCANQIPVFQTWILACLFDQFFISHFYNLQINNSRS